MTNANDKKSHAEGRKDEALVDKELDEVTGGLVPQPLLPRQPPWRELNPQPLPP